MHGGDRFKDGGQKSLEVICLQASVHQVHPLQSFDASGKRFCNIFGIEDQISAPRASQQKKVQRKSAELIKQTAAKMFSKEGRAPAQEGWIGLLKRHRREAELLQTVSLYRFSKTSQQLVDLGWCQFRAGEEKELNLLVLLFTFSHLCNTIVWRHPAAEARAAGETLERFTLRMMMVMMRRRGMRKVKNRSREDIIVKANLV